MAKPNVKSTEERRGFDVAVPKLSVELKYMEINPAKKAKV